MHLRPLIRAALASVAVLLCLSIQAAAQSYSIDAHVIAAGTPARSGSACFRLDATVAEPAAGYSSSVDYAVSAGFRAIAATTGGNDIFFAGFEECSP